MKLLITTLTMIFISFGAKAHSLNGEYKCRTSSYSLFKTTVVVNNFTKNYESYEIIFNQLTQQEEFKKVRYEKPWQIKADVFFDKIKLKQNGDIYNIENNKKKRTYIRLQHNDKYGEYRNEGIKFIVKEKEFSEKSGSKWVTKRSVFCEKQ